MIVTERYTLVSDNIMRYEATIDDPQTFARPWTIRMPLYRHVEENARLLEFNCVEFSEELLYGDLMTRDAEPGPEARQGRRQGGLRQVAAVNREVRTMSWSTNAAGAFATLAAARAFVVLALAFAAGTASAHHSFAAGFDINQPIRLRGVVIRMELTNPHSWIHPRVTTDSGEVQEWAIEGAAPNALIRRGWNRNSLPPGTEVTVLGDRARDGSNTANGGSVTLPDGSTLFVGSTGIGAPSEEWSKHARVGCAGDRVGGLRRIEGAVPASVPYGSGPYGSANVNSALPAVIATYCLRSIA